MDRMAMLERACRTHGVLAVYLFGSRADDGRALLNGAEASRHGSDLDVGVFFDEGAVMQIERLAALQVIVEDVFAPLHVDLVPLDRVDGLFQFRAISGHRVFALETSRVDLLDLLVMRRAADLLPLQRQIERERFGVATS